MIDGYKLEPVEDYDYWLRITEHCEIVFVPDILMEYRTDSPLSISAQLRNSKVQHRRWRYAFNLAKHQARNRRSIPFKLTVIYPVQDGSEKTVNKLEELLEQSFSNYKLVIIDTSFNQAGINVMQHISDPRVKFIALPGANKKEAILTGMKDADTPFTLIYGEGLFPSAHFVLYNLVLFHEQFIQQGLEKTMIATIDNNYGHVASRIELSGDEPVIGNLYLTKRLLEILKQRENQKGQ